MYIVIYIKTQIFNSEKGHSYSPVMDSQFATSHQDGGTSIAHTMSTVYLLKMSFYRHRIESAARTSYRVQEGDILLMGTDGLFDNMHEDMIVDYISKYKVLLNDLPMSWR